MANAPHLTRLQAFIIPTYRYFDQLFYASGLLLYDALAGKLSLSRTKLLSKKSLVQLMPTIHGKGLKGGIVYADGQFDDARLVMSLALTANDLGGVVLNYANVTGLTKNDGKVSGVVFIDEENNKTYEIASKSVINATGVFVDTILDMDDKSSPAAVMPSQGVHLVIDREFFPSDHALMIPKTRDGRVLLQYHGKMQLSSVQPIHHCRKSVKSPQH